MEELKSGMPEKIKVYSDFVDLFADILMDKNPKPYKAKALGQKLSRIGMKLFLLAPDGVVQAYLKWRALATMGEDPQEVVEAYADTLVEMRTDVLGKGETGLYSDTAMDLWG